MKKGKNPEAGFGAKQNLKTPPTNDNLASFPFSHQDKIDFRREILYKCVIKRYFFRIICYGIAKDV